MPRVRRTSRSAFDINRIDSSGSTVSRAFASELRFEKNDALTSRDPVKFIRVMTEIERLRGRLAHPESPTLH